ncbi:PepSY-associated TM helix domain-containing protein [Brevundimonas diminuta]|uniref:PepSY-associated TM helix domain-containing protein n=1 Tax=Brevundimonas diminuta TaxID=293 RepID=UPI001F58DEE2|nr:PepSY domain-containing protein [Brevundimonas diminuta]
MARNLDKTTPDDLSGAYRAVWRWHFYAGVFVMPVLMLLALTGGLYLFKDEIDGFLYRDMIRVPAVQTQAAPETWVASAAQAAGGGRVANLVMPARDDEAIRLRVDRPDGVQKTVFVDPHTSRATGVIPAGGFMELVKKTHSLTLLGRPFNILVEIVAGWTIILFATGLYLWWPRGRGVATFAPQTTDSRRRPFWRDLHALTGFYVGGVVLFLAVTGMPWSAVWGDKVMGAVKETGLGRPPAPVAGAWQRVQHHDAPVGAGWTMEGMVMTHDHAGHGGLAQVLRVADQASLARPYTVNIPKADDTAYTLTTQATRVQDSRSLYVDAASGRLLGDIGYHQFGAGAKAIEFGIYTHQGTQFGQANRIVMLMGCIGVWLLAISGLVMWWKRRPPNLSRRRLGAPPAPPGPRARAAVLGIVLPLAILYPLTGLSLIAAVLLDRALRPMIRRRSAAS